MINCRLDLAKVFERLNFWLKLKFTYLGGSSQLN